MENSTGEPLTLSDLAIVFASRVPGFPANANSDFDLTRSGLLDHAQRSALKHAVAELFPQIDHHQLDAASTFGDLEAILTSTPGQAAGPPLRRGAYRTARIRLRPYREQDLPALYEAALAPESAFRWRFRGRTPSPEAFRSNLFNQITAQFVVESRATGRMVGIVSAYDEDLQNGHAKFAFQRTSAEEGTGGEMIEGVANFVSYLFDNFPYRKLFADLPEYNLYLINTLVDSFLTVEAELVDYYFYNQQYWDLVIVSLSRGQWDQFISGFALEDSRPTKQFPEGSTPP